MTKPLKGNLKVSGDKSISHRSIMLGSIAEGTTIINGFSFNADCMATINCFSKMGVDIDIENNTIKINGKGLYSLKKPLEPLDCKNSGTTIRLMSGILAGQNFSSTLTGDESLKKRPMNRIINPLKEMGANISSFPIKIFPSKLNGIEYISPVASAQVKSAILLAGLFADSKTSVIEPTLSRNHTEIMLKNFGADISCNGTCSTIRKCDSLYALNLNIVGDISSAAFFIVAGILVKNSEILIKNVGINPTRTGILKVLKSMGAKLEIFPKNIENGEPAADILVRHSQLHGTKISGEIIPQLIDELPIIAALACVSEGTTIIKDAGELRVKETNRIRAMTTELSKLGANVKETDDGMIIKGVKKLHNAKINTYNDHRIAMTFSILSLYDDLNLNILNKDCVNISYPDFYKDLAKLTNF